jgi:glyoxylase-like metal-dependent hydrolase (beta-lactamase superfamily II)
MLEVVRHDGVTQWRTSSAVSRAFAYTASAFLTDDGVLVDSGIPAAERHIMAQVRGAMVHGVVITHHHEDHAGNVAALAAAGVPIWLGDETRARVAQVPRIRAYRRWTWNAMAPLPSDPAPFAPTGYTVMATPGHSSDHHAVWHAATRTLFAGDLYLGVEVRVTHHDEDPYALLDSVRAAAALDPERLFCAHRGLVLNAAARLRDKAEWLTATLTAIEKRVHDGARDDEILRAVLGGESTIGRASFGEYSRRNLVRAVRRRVMQSPADQSIVA